GIRDKLVTGVQTCALPIWVLVIELQKKGKKRMAKVTKTRIEQFPDEDVFEWSYDAIRQRYDTSMLDKEAQVVELATPQQVREIRSEERRVGKEWRDRGGRE